jgi:hypothetical protein
MGLGDGASNTARGNVPEVRNTMFMVLICIVLNGKDIVNSPNQLQDSYTDVRHWSELIDFIEKNEWPKEL